MNRRIREVLAVRRTLAATAVPDPDPDPDAGFHQYFPEVVVITARPASG
jgi:hypothetical protein